MQGCGSRAEFSSGILAEIGYFNLSQVNLSKSEWVTVCSRFGGIVEVINKYAHPLVASTMGVNCATCLASSLDFNSVFAGLNTVAWILALDDEIGMSVEITIFGQ